MSMGHSEPRPEGQGRHYGALASDQRSTATAPAPWSLPRRRAYVAAAVLCYINLLNYMNWFIIAGVLLDVQKFFQIRDSNVGLLQTVFIGCLLLSAPVFGYLGDRHSRKATLTFGILLWSGAGLSSSFISRRHSWLFFLSRGIVGTGTASYSTIAPTILGDLFVRDQWTRVLAVFYIFIPVGSGLGYVLGSVVTELTGNWLWALRVMPCLEAVALVLFILLVPDPPRGAAEKQGEATTKRPRSTWCEDVRYLARNWSFVWSTFGVTATAFVTGALGFWIPKFLFEARVVHGQQLPCLREPCNSQDSLIFGSLTIMTGIIGVVLGAEASRRYKKVNPRAEPLICASSLLATALCLYLALVLAPTTLLGFYLWNPCPNWSCEPLKPETQFVPGLCDGVTSFRSIGCWCWRSVLVHLGHPCPCTIGETKAQKAVTFPGLPSEVFLALGELLLSCNWAVVADILLSVVVPRCRGTAEALQITVGHVLGDACSPYLTGLISSALRARRPNSYLQRFLSLQQSFLCCVFVVALGGGCFLLTALYLERDQTQAQESRTGTSDSKDVESQAVLSGGKNRPEGP
ncbi:protein spinster homolog 3 isoform X2 [Loxodonta africana]|uniref:protein spinster homolog 3 isoform X2 n=1 Tax=Loxodonta africana TaxID=9785 RepID=UPI0030CB6C06